MRRDVTRMTQLSEGAMQTTQKDEFEQRRLAVLRKHIENDPKIRAMRRRRKLRVFFSLTGSLIAVGVVMLLLKGFLLAVHGPQGYAQIVAPVLQGQAQASLVVQILGADPVSDEIAAILRPMLPAASEPFAATTAPSGEGLEAATDPEQAPEI